jgi:hypothetical protein
VRPGEVARRLGCVLGDEREGGEADVEQPADLVEQGADDAVDVGRPGQLAGDPAEALELPLTLVGRRGGRPLGLAGAATNRQADEEAGDERAEDDHRALPSEREADEAEGGRLDWGHTGRPDTTERRHSSEPPRSLFPASRRDSSALQRWAVRPIVRLLDAR